VDSVEELQSVERQCVAKFRAKASEIRAQHPELSVQIAYARAIQALPKTADRYSEVRQLLQWRGVAALPLR
jgi:hypothetical protein